MATRKLKIRYIKAYDFKTNLATGIFGGVTNNGLINVNFFTDRAVIPKSQTVDVDENNKIVGSPIDEKDGDLVRELQSAVMIDINTAKVVVKWLEGRIKEHETMSKNK